MDAARIRVVRPRGRTLVALLLSLAVLGAGLALFLRRDDWNWARPLAERMSQATTGRQLELGGDLRVDLGRVTTVEAHDVRFDNADWGQADDLFAAHRLAFDVRFWPLLVGRVRLERLELDEAVVALERSADGAGNWSLGGGEGAAAGFAFPTLVRVRGADLTLADPARPQGFKLRVDSLDSEARGADVVATGAGVYQSEPFRLAAVLPAQVQGEQSRIPLSLELTVGRTEARAKGTVGRAGGADVALHVAGPSLDAIWRLVGFPLPRSPAFAVDGHLRWTGRRVALSAFKARLGKSDLAGDLAVHLPEEGRMNVEADVRSRAIDFDDIEGFYGRTPREEDAPKAAPMPGPNSIFPDVAFDFAKLRVADARIRFAADRVQGTTALEEVRLDATLERGRLRLHPLSLGMSRGDLTTNAVFDAAGAESTVDAEMVVRNVDLATLLAELGIEEPAAGTFGGRADIKSHGNSLRAMARQVDGEVGVVLRRGRLSDPLLELFALHLGDYLVAKLDDRKDVRPIECLVGVFDGRNGVLEARTLLLDTRHVRIEGEGRISLAMEHIDLVLRQHSKDLSIGALRTPIEIEGPLATRRARLQTGPLLARGGAVVALGAALHPAAALLALVDLGSDDKPDACAQALAEYRPIAAGLAPEGAEGPPAPKGSPP